MPLCRNVDLKSQELRALVKQYGRIAACLPVEKAIRCARNCLTRYVKTTLAILIVKQR
ncbi:Uncharacterised protein [Salmonella enterica subsp. enterica]|uniref:Uncharacterized protein n=1 Tax=Salmonella enterica I TaxID=59201 RepID=A0A379WZN3_SALET|nr:Uncharacterised protein [Salmonella enterica subsp. enterica]